MQHFILRFLRRPNHHHCRCYHTSDGATANASVVSSINWVRDRGLDHAVEKERDLKTMLNIKNLINSEPSKSVPLSIIADKRNSLGLPIRPIDFIRKYPSVFHEYLPGGIGINPHVKLTPEILTLDTEEQLLFQSETQRQDVANRLLKLLMIARINKIPLCIIDRLKWDLGLPHDYTQTIVPQFPDYFQVTSNGNELELVCWSDKQAISVMETRSMSSFPLQYSRGFELDKKFKKWVDDWQKLPYISPYENSSHLQAKSDESDKWAVAVLHEVLHLLVPKKTEKDNLLFLGEYLGIRSRFKRALLQHPGIFYVSSKLGTHTVVLREAYKRDLLVSKPQHPFMNLRSNYIHLMYTEIKSKNAQVVGAKKKIATPDLNEGDDEEEWNGSDSEQEEEQEEEDDDDDDDEGVTDSDSTNDDMEKEGLVDNVLVQKSRSHRSNDGYSENGSANIRGKFNHNDLGRRHTPNSRVSDNDHRRRGTGGRSKGKLSEEKISSGTNNKMYDRRGARKTSRPKTEIQDDGKRNFSRTKETRGDGKTSVSRTKEIQGDGKPNVLRTRDIRGNGKPYVSRREGRF